MSFARPLLFLSLVLSVAAPASAADAPVDFARDVHPIFAARCIDCHGPAKQKGGIRLDAASALKGGDSGDPLLVPGKPADSHLIKLVKGEGDEVMPPKGEKLSAAQIDVLSRWIAQGGTWPAEGAVAAKVERPKHWSFAPPVRPAVPTTTLGVVRNPIDSFILAKLTTAGLKQSPEADRHALVRRVTFDLTGLPPTPAEVDAFVNDQSPEAYEKLVDRLLALPHFGERWARLWLDLARYADSKGYGSDPLRFTIHRYRDWVIDAFNRNKPFDQFTVEQLAGDLLPNPTQDQLIATAFHRNTMTNTEGGTDDEEFRVAAVKDRTDVTFQVWMGLTMGCAQCHTHKFDPITHRDYYSAFAIFNQTEDADRADESPTINTPTPEQERERAKLEKEVATLEATERAAAATKPTSKPTKESAALVDLRKKLAGLKPDKTAVMRELPANKQRKSTILVKGNFLQKGDPVEPAVPAAFDTLPKGAKVDRLALAKWLVSKENPLTARVQVNRLWAAFFGTGLVETQEDFGEQGQPPSHPELLDWLAVEFMEPTVNGSGTPWDVKRFMRLVVTSATYRQSAKVLPEHVERDARNRLLARMPRQRLEAEMVRDQALAVSGLLSGKMFGPSVYPPQPDGMWQAAFNGERSYPTSKGEDRYRRGVYVFWRRTVPYPSMQTFDAPSREVCTIRRVGTSTPLQAFVTMNDPVYVEASQALGRRLVAVGGAKIEDRIRFGLRLVLNRPPTDAQVKPLAKLYESELANFKQDADGATKLATQPIGPLPKGQDAAEAAAWTVVANVLLNLDGAMTR